MTRFGVRVTCFSVRVIAVVGLLALLLPGVAAPPIAHATSFSNTSAIALPDTDVSGPATPYPSTINVSGLTGVVTKLKVTINGLTHSFPDDVDILLVGPTGANAIILADVGGFATPATNVTITLDDAAASPLPDGSPLTSGTFRPANYFPADSFPAPGGGSAPPVSGGSALSVFTGTDPNGTWSLFVVDDAIGNTGGIAFGWTMEIATARLSISEFRLHGPGGAADEFVEISNDSDEPHVVTPSSGSGYGLAASDGVTRCSIPTGTTIPARGHFLCVNSNGYGLAGYRAGNGTTATGNATYTTEIPLNAGIALFNNNSGGASYSVTNRLDAVGSASEAITVYKEGSGLPVLANIPAEYSLVRAIGDDGRPKDTNNNAADFLVVDSAVSNLGAGQRLGAPGPENLSSPTVAGFDVIADLLDPCLSALAPPNQVRDAANPASNSAAGTVDVRRTITNNTGQSITRLRFRIVDLTTAPAPGGTSDLRAFTSTDASVDTHRAPCGPDTISTIVRGTTLEQPPSQPMGGGLNASLSVDAISDATPLGPGQSINVRFLLGVQQPGALRFKVLLEALPAGGSAIVSGVGDTEAAAPVTLTVNRDGTGQGTVGSSVPGIDCGADCVESYAPGTVVALTPTPGSGSTFAGWSGGCSGTGACQVTMDAAKRVTATFIPFGLRVTKSGSGTGTVSSAPGGIACGADCEESYTPGTVVTLTATPISTSRFSGWSGDCTGTGACQVTVDGAKAVTATFQRVDASVSVGGGLVTSGPKTLTATLAARSGCGPIQQVRFGNPGQSFNNGRVGISAPAGGPSNQVSGFTYTPPAGTTTVSLTIQRVVQTGGATVTPIVMKDGCGDWRTFIGGGPSAFQ